MRLAAALLDRWERFCFTPQAMPILGIIRICYGVLTLINMLELAPYLELFFTDRGVMPLAQARLVLDPQSLIPLGLLPQKVEFVRICYAVFLLQIALLIAGWHSRFQAGSILFWLVAFQHRNIIIFDGEDVLFRLLAFYLMLSPCGAYYAVDSRRDTRPHYKRQFAAWPLQLIRIQMIVIYFSTLGEKLRGTDWLEGTALYYVSRLDDLFSRYPLPAAIFDCVSCLTVATRAVLVVELLIPCLLCFPRSRKLALLLAVPFHLGIEYSMNLNLFHWLMLTGLLSFVVWEGEGRPSENSAAAGRL